MTDPVSPRQPIQPAGSPIQTLPKDVQDFIWELTGKPNAEGMKPFEQISLSESSTLTRLCDLLDRYKTNPRVISALAKAIREVALDQAPPPL